MAPTGGSARVAGFDVFTQSMDVRKNIGYLPESTPLYGDMRVAEYLDFRGRIRGMDRATRKKRIAHVAEKCWLTDRLRSLIATLSKGYKQRVGIADALLHDPRVLVLDEPTAGLDPAQNREARKLIAELANEHTVLLCTHILQEVEMVCKQVIIIARGQIVAQGTPDELKTRASSGGIRIEARAPSDQLAAALNALQGVSGVDILQTGGVSRMLVKGKSSVELRELISGEIAKRGWGLREMRSEGASLEEFFVDITDPARA
jgi:ABC-2 type transport system ATP-binding protein